MKFLKIFSVILSSFLFATCNKQPYEPPAYNAKAYVIGEEICNSGSNYNYWLLALTETNATYSGDTISYNGFKFTNVFKAMNLDTSLKHAGKRASFKFNYSTADHKKIQSLNCNASNAESFLLEEIVLFAQEALP